MSLQRIKFKDIEQVPHLKVNKEFKTQFQGSAPAPFIGRYNYPNVNIGILSPQFSGDTSYYDSPQLWSKGNFKIGSVASLRYGLVNSRSQGNIKQLNTRFVQTVQEVGMAKITPELEIHLAKKPELNIKPESDVTPFGPQAQVATAKITGNVKVNQHVEKAVQDTDLKAVDALTTLYKQGLEEAQLNKVLSVGSLGLKQNRKLVPTRWSITAVDDTIGKQLIEEIKNYPQIDYQAYFGGSWGNYYLILYFTDNLRYELFETYLALDTNPWSKEGYKYSTDYEDYNGRTNYAEETAGGYYACRLPVLEKLKELKRQGSILALRFITEGYNLPLGVWVCRQATRKSLQEQSVTFASKELMLNYAKEIIKRKFGFDLNLLLSESRILKENQRQHNLNEY
ncbi:hypothetical protein HYV86_01670 [Candidatus Woesearchaeota archaeon]|nr:hypothetical protein [Candidatus Woesearchaeota archaeon]